MRAKVALVTGASRGLGLACAEALKADGCAVIGLARHSPESPDHFDDFLLEDATVPHAVKSGVRRIARDHGPVSICINAAGIAAMNHFTTTPIETLARVSQVNYLGTATVCQAVLPGMIRQKYGRIVNFSTVAVGYNLAGEAAYVASKAAVEALGRVLAHEVGPFGITVNTIAPPPIATRLLAGIPIEKVEALVARQAIPRMGEPADVMNVLRFLTADETGMVTGQVIRLGGP